MFLKEKIVVLYNKYEKINEITNMSGGRTLLSYQSSKTLCSSHTILHTQQGRQ